MFIERVEIFGFKSFARKTELAFGPGLCVIMGPNGCGKSNILDGIRWAIGEQRLSLLRSSLLEDVIFNGSAGMRPLNFAEVSVQLADAKGILQYDAQSDRIRITRRTFRDGESKFLINNASVRLKDIRSVLAAVGLGDVGYAVIEQQMIERVLGGGVEERRVLFEQAAGISKYKSDKAATQSKLRSTQEDLIRLEDILSELSEQEAILRRQVRRAKRYRNLLENARKTEVALIAGRLARYESERKSASEKVNRIKVELQNVSARFAELRAKIQRIAARQTELERKRNVVIDEERKIEHKLAETERKIAVLNERIENANKTIKNAEETKIELVAKIRTANERQKNVQQALAELQRSLENVEVQSKKLQKQNSEVNKKLLNIRREMTDLQSQNDAIRHRFSELSNKNAFADAEMKRIEKQLLLNEEQIKTASAKHAAHSEDANRIGAQIAEMDSRMEDILSRLSNIKAERTSVQEKLSEEMRKISQLKQKRSELVGRLEELSGIIKRGEDIGTTAHSLLKEKKNLNIVGLVAEMLHFSPEHSLAAERLLGERANFIAVEKIDDVISACRSLPNNSGEIGFIVLSELSAPKDMPQWLTADDDRLAELIVGASLEKSSSLDDFVSLDGVRISFDGRILRKRGEVRISMGKPPSGTLTIRAQVKQLSSDIKKIEAELAELNDNYGGLEGKFSRLDDEIARYESELAKLRENRTKKHRSYEWTSATLTQTENSIRRMKEQRKELENSLKNLKLDSEKWQSSLDEISATRSKLAEKIEGLQRKIDELEAQRRQIEEKISATEVERIKVNGEIRHAKQDIEREDIAVKDAQQQIEELEKTVFQAKSAITTSKREIEELNRRMQELFSRRDAAENEHEKLRGEIEDLNSSLVALRKDEQKISAERERCQTTLTESEKELSALTSAIEEVRKMALDELGDIPPPSEPISQERERELQRKLTSYRKSIEQTGAVNLEAEQQYALVKERLDFLLAQKADIIESIGDLKRTINKLDEEAKRLFLQTFESTRENFAKVFSRLFEDGQADIALEKPDEPLSSDILVRVRPAGKRQLTLSQLSAGEKALTALALLFALYLVKPAPFCLMDEVDAPLDDVNVARFLRLVQEFSNEIQFIIVSHNRTTLQRADYLYGVSMERDGVSKIVSVKMSDLKLKLE